MKNTEEHRIGNVVSLVKYIQVGGTGDKQTVS